MAATRFVRLGLMLLGLMWLATTASPAAAQDTTVLRTRVADTITPVVADHLSAAVSQAERQGHSALLVELDTPGGLDTSMRQIVQSFLNADVPVIVYVSPSGARAASAGSIITSAAHVAAMSPGTTIGAATPVNAETGETASDKAINDAAAYAATIAAQRGRNTDFATDTVRQGRAVPAEEALEIGAVDLIAPDAATVLAASDGRTVTLGDGRQTVVRTAGAALVDFEVGFFRSLLQILANPNLAFLFLSIGTLAVIYELASPGMGFGGVIGAIMLVLAFVALSVLPVSVAGLVLLVLAAALFIAEVFTPGIGVFAGGGTVALLFAGLFLFDEPQVRVDPIVLWPTVLIIGGGVLLAGRLAWRARSAQPVSGAEAFAGRETVIQQASGTTGQTRFEGGWWKVRSEHADLREGQTVRVVGVDGLTLRVEPTENERQDS